MPFNFNAVFDVKPDADGGCTGVAGALDAGNRRECRRRLARWRAARPADLTFRQLELNAQVVRFPPARSRNSAGRRST